MEKVLKWIGIGVVSAFAFMGVVGLVGAVAMMATDSDQSQAKAEPKQEKTLEAKPAADKQSEDKVQPKTDSGQDAMAQDASAKELAQQQEENADLQKQIEDLEEQQDKQEKGTPAPKEAASKQAVPAAGPNADDAVKAAAAYYDNSAAGDWDATYAQLSSNSTAYYTPEDWATANNALGTGTFEVTYAEETEPNVFYAEVLVNGTARDTYWIYDGGQYYHDLTTEEYAMFDDALAGGSATASASDSSSAAPSTDSAGSGQVNVTVEVSAAAPVDVSIMSVEDMDVPMISEQTANETYEFTADSGADLTVDAMSNKDDIFAEDGIYVAVYENGELVAEDNDGAWAMISTTV